jgi:valyl-tRNA synthetase
VDKELSRLTKDRDATARDIARGEAMLKNEGFLAKAPAQLIETEKGKLETARKTLETLEERIKEIEALR